MLLRCFVMLSICLTTAVTHSQTVLNTEYELFLPDGSPVARFNQDDLLSHRLYNGKTYALRLSAENVSSEISPIWVVAPIEDPLSFGEFELDVSSPEAFARYAPGWMPFADIVYGAGTLTDPIMFGDRTMVFELSIRTLPTVNDISEGIIGSLGMFALAEATGTVPLDLDSISIRSVLYTSTPSWQNLAFNEDTNGDGVVSPIDALLVINHLSSANEGLVPLEAPNPNQLVDVNGDGYIAPLDALRVINAL